MYALVALQLQLCLGMQGGTFRVRSGTGGADAARAQLRVRLCGGSGGAAGGAAVRTLLLQCGEFPSVQVMVAWRRRVCGWGGGYRCVGVWVCVGGG